ncbi:hypothetical protein C5167_037956 [Papaver somniferum]|uniref:Uncharacterized protein n=1 Tax=Papaver somniferum TaxID=3469 RepID=A0A4Y7IC63_PAPSO|nr:hypothetical protein C5167_037956 [Papaver somniferum]
MCIRDQIPPKHHFHLLRSSINFLFFYLICNCSNSTTGRKLGEKQQQLEEEDIKEVVMVFLCNGGNAVAGSCSCGRR